MLYKLLNIFLVLIVFNINLIVANNNNFCIENLKNPENNLTTDCNIKVQLISDEEKIVLQDLCKVRGKLFNDTKILTLKNGTFNSLKQLNCANNLEDIQFVWLSHDKINSILNDNTNIHEEIIAKSTNDTLSDSVICSFSIRNQNCGIRFENQNGLVVSHFNILAQLQPLDLIISNIEYKPWKNVTNSGYKMPMSGKILLTNYHTSVYKQFDTIKFSYFDKISLNINEIIPKELNNNLELPAKVDYNGQLLEIEKDGNAYAPINKELTFSRTLPPLSSENATLVGESTTYIVEYSAMTQYNYGSGYKVNLKIHDCKVTIKTNTDIDIIYSGPMPLNYTTPNTNQTFTETKPNIDEVISQRTPEYVKYQTINNNQINISGHVYPNFYPWFVAAAIFLSVLALGTFGNMIKIKYQEKTLKKKRYRTGSLL